jgi:hypothetical protein
MTLSLHYWCQLLKPHRENSQTPNSFDPSCQTTTEPFFVLYPFAASWGLHGKPESFYQVRQGQGTTFDNFFYHFFLQFVIVQFLSYIFTFSLSRDHLPLLTVSEFFRQVAAQTAQPSTTISEQCSVQQQLNVWFRVHCQQTYEWNSLSGCTTLYDNFRQTFLFNIPQIRTNVKQKSMTIFG